MNITKRGTHAQVSVFIIVAIALLAGLGLFFLFRQGILIGQVPPEFKPVYEYYLSCIEEETIIASTIAGHQGGYIDTEKLGFNPGSMYMPFSNQLDFLGSPVPYWYYISGNGIVKEQKPTKENIEGWFKAGVCAVGMGSKLISKKLMEAKDYATIETETKKLLELIASIKK